MSGQGAWPRGRAVSPSLPLCCFHRSCHRPEVPKVASSGPPLARPIVQPPSPPTLCPEEARGRPRGHWLPLSTNSFTPHHSLLAGLPLWEPVLWVAQPPRGRQVVILSLGKSPPTRPLQLCSVVRAGAGRGLRFHLGGGPWLIPSSQRERDGSWKLLLKKETFAALGVGVGVGWSGHGKPSLRHTVTHPAWGVPAGTGQLPALAQACSSHPLWAV